MTCRRVSIPVVYPVNKDVPQTSQRLGEILAIYQKTGQLTAPLVEGAFEVEAIDGKVDFPEKSTHMNQSKLDIGKSQHDAVFGSNTEVPPTE